MRVSEEPIAMAEPRRSVWLLLVISGGVALELVWIGGWGWLAFKAVEYLIS
jgi:hypothetical protein